MKAALISFNWNEDDPDIAITMWEGDECWIKAEELKNGIEMDWDKSIVVVDNEAAEARGKWRVERLLGISQ